MVAWCKTVRCDVMIKLSDLRCRAIIQTREELLIEMFHLLQRKENPGQLFAESNNTQGLALFMHKTAERFIEGMGLREKCVTLLLLYSL